MIKLKINSKVVEVENGTSVMKAAQQMGFEIPNMCWHDELEHFTSCMLCMVKDQKNGRLYPSCSVKAVEGMEVITDDQEIAESRKTALELLLSETCRRLRRPVSDCLSGTHGYSTYEPFNCRRKV